MRLKVAAIVVLLVVAGGAIALSTGVLKPSTTAATTFLTAAAATQDVTDEVTATGNVASSWTYALSFGADPTATAASSSSSSSNGSSSSSSNSSSNSSSSAGSVTWPVTSVSVKVGDRVTKGQVLAKADTADLEAQIADANRAAVSSAIQVDQAQDALDSATGTDPIRQAKVSLYNAETQKAKAYSDLADLKALRTKASLAAPADGIVTAVNVTDGADAPSGTAISLQSAALEVTTDVVESDVTKISVGQQATLTIAAINATLNGTVASIAPSGSASGSNGVVQYAVEVALDAPPQALKPGMSADISIVTASASGVLAIPSRALAGTAGSYTVRVVDADGTVETRSVTVGLVTSSLAEIQSGLQAGERVVTGTSATQQNGTQANGGLFGGGAGRLGGGGVVTNPGR
ncbi:MAG TPA: efflux RND transporter periplasmic adaptor subunit [Candidatus Limnocylindrales bacterium]